MYDRNDSRHVSCALAIMTETEFRKMFPRASVSTLSANPQLLPTLAKQNVSSGIVGSAKGTPTPFGLRSAHPAKPWRSRMNKTEAEFAMQLEAQKCRGDIRRYEFEGLTLRFAGVRYTPDFVVFPSAIAISGQVKLVEVKGRFIKGKFERAIERFRHAKTFYGDLFLFELHQKTAQGWRRIL
jgi:hypothetical protein